jgi:hypothetical protein
VSLVVGPAGLLLSQRAFQVGRLLAPVNAIISSVDPVTATTIAVLALGERLATTRWPCSAKRRVPASWFSASCSRYGAATACCATPPSSDEADKSRGLSSG